MIGMETWSFVEIYLGWIYGRVRLTYEHIRAREVPPGITPA
jgi:hypothetical protein